MKILTTILTVGAVLGALGGRAAAQTTNGLQIAITGYGVAADGGERIRVKGVVDATGIGTLSSHTIVHSRGRGCVNGVGPTDSMGTSGQTVGPDGQMIGTDSVWVVEVTPLRVAADAVTFKLHWLRARDNGRPSTQPSGDTEATLRPGQSMPLDVVVGPAPPGSTEPCVRSLRVGVERTPEPDQDRRLISAELWLVDRLPDGTERNQSLSLRGLYGQAIPFYFDRLSQGAMSLDLFGDVQVLPGKDGSAATVALKGRIINSAFADRPFDYVTSTMVKTPLVTGEVVSVALPPIGQGNSPALAGHTLSLRLRFRQIR